jgi:hypothetical protein
MPYDAVKTRWAVLTADRIAETLAQGIQVFDEEEGQAYIHDGITPGGVPMNGASGSTETFGYQALTTITAAGNSNCALGANDLRKTFDATATGGAGVYTHTLTLQTTNAGAGDHAEVMVALPASANPTIEIRNATSGGTLLQSLNNPDAVAALQWSGEFVYTGSAWKFVRGAFHSF